MPAERKYHRDVLVPEICGRLATGEPLSVICRDLGIPVRTIHEWRETDEEIAAQFFEARDTGYDEIAHRSRKTIRGKGPSEGGESTGDVVRDKAIVEHDLKLLAKWDPRNYGDKQQLEHSGPNGGPIKTVNANLPVDPAEASRIYMELMQGKK